MKRYQQLLVIGLVVILASMAVGIVTTCSRGNATGVNTGGVVPEPDVTVNAYPGYARDIQPIFNKFCVSCHSSDDAPNWLHLDSFEGVIKGTKFGPVIVSGKPEMSSLVALIKHESDPKIWMPYHKEQLSPNRIKNIEDWVLYGVRNN